MSFSDSEALPDAPRAAFADHGPPRCRSAPCRLLPGMDLEDLEQMTSEAIELFRKGQQPLGWCELGRQDFCKGGIGEALELLDIDAC